jgi:photosystem II stability/assembly factor-like uncharacterized protein
MKQMVLIARTALVVLASAALASGCAAASSAPRAAGPSTASALGTTGKQASQSPDPPGAAASSAPPSRPASGAASSASCSAGPSASSGQAPALAAVQFVDPRHGWAAGAGRVLATTDGGRTWIRQYGGSADLDQVDFTDRQHGWAIGGDTLLRTTDGGATWTPLPQSCSSQLISVHFVSATAGYAIRISASGLAQAGLFTSVPSGSLVRTTDGGATWTAGSAPKSPQSACFANASDGYLGTPGRIWRSINGGRSWGLVLSEPHPSSGSSAQTLDTPEIECAGSRAAWVLFLGEGAAMSHAPYLAYTSQDGQAWHAMFEEQYTESGLRPGLTVPEGPGSYPGPFSAIDSATAAFVGFSPAVGNGVAPLELASDNGRVLAKDGNVATINEPLAAAFLSAAQGWVVGENLRTRAFSIEATTNSGRTWTTQYTTG